VSRRRRPVQGLADSPCGPAESIQKAVRSAPNFRGDAAPCQTHHFMGEPEPVVLTREQRSARMNELNNHANLIWGIAELLRGDYKQSEYGRVILPLVVMRRLDQALEATKKDVLDKVADLERRGIDNMERSLRGATGLQFFNRSPLTFPQLLNDPGQIAGLSLSVAEITTITGHLPLQVVAIVTR
jgi:type I restriction enzyme M protein